MHPFLPLTTICSPWHKCPFASLPPVDHCLLSLATAPALCLHLDYLHHQHTAAPPCMRPDKCPVRMLTPALIIQPWAAACCPPTVDTVLRTLSTHHQAERLWAAVRHQRPGSHLNVVLAIAWRLNHHLRRSDHGSALGIPTRILLLFPKIISFRLYYALPIMFMCCLRCRGHACALECASL